MGIFYICGPTGHKQTVAQVTDRKRTVSGLWSALASSGQSRAYLGVNPSHYPPSSPCDGLCGSNRALAAFPQVANPSVTSAPTA
jgi:hypothetical protein